MASRHALMVVNEFSRNGGDQCFQQTRQILEAGGISVSRISSTDPTTLSSAIVKEGRNADMVIIGGGDGTLNAALEGIISLGKPLGLLPLGTANDFARTLNIPVNIEAAARLIVQGHEREVDLGRVNGKHFVNVSSMGLSVEITNELTQDLKKKLGKAGYLVGAWRAWRKNNPFRVHLTVDGRTYTLKALQVAVGNGVYFGGGMQVAADAAIDDQQLDVFVLKPMNILQYISLLPRLKAGRQGLANYVETYRGRCIRVETSGKLEINTDGEITTATPANYDLRPHQLRVYVPRRSDAS